MRGAVTVSADAADNFGVARVDLALGGATGAPRARRSPPPSTPPSCPDGPTSATARATDVNGLASAVASAPVTIDNTPPTLDVTGPSNRTYAPGSTQVWVLAGADATSGVAALQCSLAKAGEPASFRACSGSPTVEIADNQPPGVYRFTARVVDAAGNVTDVTRDFTIAATLEAALTANGGKLPGSDGTGALAVLPVTLAYDFYGQAQRDALLRADAQAHPERRERPRHAARRAARARPTSRPSSRARSASSPT